jgi:hypothetical protein
VNLYGTTVTINDPTNPSVDAVGGPLFSGGWKRGTVSATATASDVTGIKSVRFYSDGALVPGATIDRASQCDYSTVAPCANPAAGASFALDTSLLSDGSHSIEVAAVDATGTNETKAGGQTVQVDNTAPTKPTHLEVTGGGASASFDVAFDVPAQTHAPVATAMYEACSGGLCINGSRPASGTSATLTGIALPAGGTYAVKVWLVDAAGNGNYNNAASGSVTYLAPSGGGGGGGGGGGSAKPAAPTTPTTPTEPSGPPAPTTPSGPNGPNVPNAGTVPAQPTRPATRAAVTGAAKVSKTGRLTVDGRISRAARGKVVVTYRAKVRGVWTTKSVKAQIRGGRYHAVMRLPSGWKHARGVKVTARYAGSRTVAAQTKRLKVTSTTG